MIAKIIASGVRTSTQVTFCRVLEAILPVPAAASEGVKVERVARASDNGALVSRDIRMQTSERLLRETQSPIGIMCINAQRMQRNESVENEQRDSYRSCIGRLRADKRRKLSVITRVQASSPMHAKTEPRICDLGMIEMRHGGHGALVRFWPSQWPWA